MEGCGRYELGRALFGLIPHSNGKIFIDGQSVNIDNPYKAMKLGISFLPRDRKNEGILKGMSVTRNIAYIHILKDIVLKNKNYIKIAKDFKELLNIKMSSLNQNIQSLSGGNQQKCVIGRWLAKDAKIFILEEPTRGVDIGTKVEIFNILDELVKNKFGIILISSELEEMMNFCDRIIVMFRGKLVKEFFKNEATKEKITAAATSGR